jgi:hypothetical protein
MRKHGPETNKGETQMKRTIAFRGSVALPAALLSSALTLLAQGIAVPKPEVALSTDRSTAQASAANYPVHSVLTFQNVYWNDSTTYWTASGWDDLTHVKSFVQQVAPSNDLTSGFQQYPVTVVQYLGDVIVQGPVSASITDLEIQTTLSAWIKAGQILPNTPDMLYNIFFPPGVTISNGSDTSNTTICAYNGTAITDTVTGALLRYSVIPYQGQGSSLWTRCGHSSTYKENLTATLSHEIADAMTGPTVGASAVLRPPLTAKASPSPLTQSDTVLPEQAAPGVLSAPRSSVLENNQVSGVVLSDPGAAMNGDEFYVIKNNLAYRRQNGTWTAIQQIGSIVFPAAAPSAPDRFFAVIGWNGQKLLYQYDGTAAPSKQWTYYGKPPGTDIATQVSQVMYGNRVYLIGTDNNLWEMKFGSSGYTWYNFGTSPFAIAIAQSPPVVLYDGSLFIIDSKGELINMWWNGSHWIFLNNGYCDIKGSWPFTSYTKAVSIGAPMFSSKIFVTCSDGTLRERWYNSSNGLWAWNNHGKPPSGYADTVPVTVSDGKLFLNVSNSSSGPTAEKHLVELYFNGTQWVWNDHGHPSGGWLAGAATSDPSSTRIYVRGQDDQYYEFSWNGTWQWVSHGAP